MNTEIKMICNNAWKCNCECPEKVPHDITPICHLSCFGSKCIEYQEPKFPGVTFEREECYLIPVKDVAQVWGGNWLRLGSFKQVFNEYDA